MSRPPDVLVGRGAELEVLRELVHEAREGTFGAVVLEGDAGIGKTTLVAAAREAGGEDVLVLSGSCLPMTSVAVPLIGLRSAVRSLSGEERPAVLGGPGGPGTGTPGVPVPVAFDDWLSERASARPVMLVVDDLHWADEETLDTLMYVLAGPAERGLAVLLTVRSTEVGPDHPLRRWLADARRLPGVRELELGPLTRDEVAAQIEAVLGGPTHSSLVDEVHARARGNPYFSRLLVTGLDPSARSLPDHLPEELSSAAIRSWGALSDDARRLVVGIAIGGRPGVGRALAHAVDVAGLDDPAPALHEAVDAGMLDIGEDGAFWFHHPLQAQALEERLLPEERRVLHAGLAAAYEDDVTEGGPSPDLAETISNHHLLADDLELAAGWALRACEAMERGRDPVGRLRMLRRAVALGGGAPGDLLALLGDTRELAEEVGDFAAEIDAIDAMTPLLDASTVADDALRSAVLGARRTLLRLVLGRAVEDADRLDGALERIASAPRSWQRLYVLGVHEHHLLQAGRTDDARHAAGVIEELLAETESMGPGGPDGRQWVRARAVALSSLAMLAAGNDPARGHVLGTRAADLAADVRDWMTLLDAVFWETNTLTPRSPECLETIAFRLDQMSRIGIPHGYLAWLSAADAHYSFDVGDVARSATRLRVALGADPGPAGGFLARLVAARMASWQGRQGEAEAHLARADELVTGPESFVMWPYVQTKATVLLHGGDLDGAVAAVLPGLEPTPMPPTGCEWLAPLAARALADLAERARDEQRDAGSVLERLDRLRAEVPHVVRDLGERSGYYEVEIAGLDALYDAETARARGSDEVVTAWSYAVDALDAARFAWEECYARWRAGEALLAHGGSAERRAAAEHLRSGYALASRLGAEPVRASIEAVARSARISLGEVAGSVADGEGLDVLTRREREVVAHVVAGRTYAEIADALFLSEKTVSSHISNILRKTGTANRVELASWARRQGSA